MRGARRRTPRAPRRVGGEEGRMLEPSAELRVVERRRRSRARGAAGASAISRASLQGASRMRRAQRALVELAHRARREEGAEGALEARQLRVRERVRVVARPVERAQPLGRHPALGHVGDDGAQARRARGAAAQAEGDEAVAAWARSPACAPEARAARGARGAADGLEARRAEERPELALLERHVDVLARARSPRAHSSATAIPARRLGRGVVVGRRQRCSAAAGGRGRRSSRRCRPSRPPRGRRRASARGGRCGRRA